MAEAVYSQVVERRTSQFWPKWQRPMIGAAAIIAFLLLWEALLTWALPMNPFVISKPSLIFAGWWAVIINGELWSDLLVSFRPFVLGFGAAAVIGVALGVVMGWRRRIGYALDPLFTALYASPLVAVAPLIIIFFGVGVTGKAVLIFVLCVFTFIFNTYAGVRAMDPLLINVVRSLGGTEKDICLKVIMPSVLPFLMAGTRIAIGHGLVGILVGEFFAATSGVGYRIAWLGDMYVVDRMFAYIFTVMAIAVMFTEGIRWAERVAFPWRVGM